MSKCVSFWPFGPVGFFGFFGFIGFVGFVGSVGFADFDVPVEPAEHIFLKYDVKSRLRD